MEPSSTHYTIARKQFLRVTTLLERTGHSNFSAIPSRDRAYYMSRGKSVHELAEHIERGVDHQFTYDAETEKYRPSIMRFLSETGFKAIRGGIEKRVHATWEELGFKQQDYPPFQEAGLAGTLDRLGKMGDASF